MQRTFGTTETQRHKEKHQSSLCLRVSVVIAESCSPGRAISKQPHLSSRYTLFMIIFGHRGAPGYPRRGENTHQSFRKAVGVGATGLEFDVRRCGDGRLVVIHDDTVDRTTNGRGLVRSLSYDELRQFD